MKKRTKQPRRRSFASVLQRPRAIPGKSLGRLSLALAVAVSWQIASYTLRQPFLPSLTDVGDFVVRLATPPLLIEHVLPSIARTIVGFLVGCALAAVIGLTIGLIRSLDDWLTLALEFVRGLPVVAILPAALLLLGATDSMRVSVIAIGSFFPVLLASVDAARRIDPLQVETARILGFTKSETLRKVALPSALPQVFAGMRISLGIALIMMVVSEMLAASNGLGFFIQRNQRLFQAAAVYAGVLVIGVIAWLLSSTLLAVERRLLFWRSGQLGKTGRNAS